MGDLSADRVTGPLEPYVSGFVTELVERGYTPVSVAHQLRLMAHVSRWLASEGFGRMTCHRCGLSNSWRRGALLAT